MDQETYHRKLRKLVSDACLAEELFSLDELEEYARAIKESEPSRISD